MKETMKEKMKKRFARVLGNESGVTLIELLAVVVILAIIAAVAVPAVLGQFNSAKKATDQENDRIIGDAINRLITDEYAAGATNITITIDSTKDLTKAALAGTNLQGVGSTTPSYKIGDLLTSGISYNGNQAYINSIPKPKSNSDTNFKLDTSATGTDGVDYYTLKIDNTNSYCIYP